MSFRLRLTLILVAMVVATGVAAWLIAGSALRPFARNVMSDYVDQAVYVAQEIEKGADPRTLGERLNLEVRLSRRAPRGGPKRRRRCIDKVHKGYELIVCRGRRAPVSVKTSRGWMIVRRDLDPDSPHERIFHTLLIALVVIALVAAWVGGLAVKPLSAAKDAMGRIAAGDLSHRLDTDGPREIAAAARSFNQMAERVQEMLQTERTLMAGISHELRTPLARLRLETELLRDAGVSPKRLDAVEGDLAEMDRLIGELLEISRLSLGERTLNRAPVDLAAVVEEAIERTPAPKHEVVVSGTAERIKGDHDRLVRVVSNLLSNSVKYAPEGTRIDVQLDGRAVAVIDQGPGVPEASLDRLFEPFYRAASNPRSTAGLGLGLMIVHQVVALHGGTIVAANRPEGGLCVRFELPAVAAA